MSAELDSARVRLDLMSDTRRGYKWDLSPNDRKAISVVLAELHRRGEDADRLYTTVDEAFGPFAVMSTDETITVLSARLFAQRFEVERLRAVADVAQGLSDYTEDSGTCAVCDGYLTVSDAERVHVGCGCPGAGMHICIADCPGRALRDALAKVSP